MSSFLVKISNLDFSLGRIVVEENDMEIQIGDGVQWFDNGLRFGWVKKLGYKWAKVNHPVWGLCKVRTDELIKYENEVKRDGKRKATARRPH